MVLDLRGSTDGPRLGPGAESHDAARAHPHRVWPSPLTSVTRPHCSGLCLARPPDISSPHTRGGDSHRFQILGNDIDPSLRVQSPTTTEPKDAYVCPRRPHKAQGQVSVGAIIRVWRGSGSDAGDGRRQASVVRGSAARRVVGCLARLSQPRPVARLRAALPLSRYSAPQRFSPPSG